MRQPLGLQTSTHSAHPTGETGVASSKAHVLREAGIPGPGEMHKEVPGGHTLSHPARATSDLGVRGEARSQAPWGKGGGGVRRLGLPPGTQICLPELSPTSTGPLDIGHLR